MRHFADLRIIGLASELFTQGVCGPVLFPSLHFDTKRAHVPQPFVASQSGYGTERGALGLPRATLRWPVEFQGRQAIEILACSIYEPPTPPPPPVQPGFRQETCNGIDDNGNGQIDESIACALLSCTACVPVSECGLRRCVTIPNGCGSTVACPCP
jgi:hypothetical protein